MVCDLTSGLEGHNITCDNFFTSYNLGQILLRKNLTLLGTISKNKPELPHLNSNLSVHSSSFYFTKDTTVVNYVPKKKKNVILLSTLHHDKEISDRIDRKPKMILDYNATKDAVDTLDQLLSTYTCKRKTNGWPVIVFYNMLDISAYNAYVLWTSINPQWNKDKLYKRRLFLEELGKCLINPYIISRTHKPRTEESCNIIKKLKTSQSTVPRGLSENIRPVKRARCRFCSSKNDNKTSILCSRCKKYICKSHTTYYCPSCLPK